MFTSGDININKINLVCVVFAKAADERRQTNDPHTNMYSYAFYSFTVVMVCSVVCESSSRMFGST